MAYLYSVSWTPPPGTIGLTHLYGSAAARASLGARLLSDNSTYNHAFIVLRRGLVAEAWPTGARVVPLADFDREDVAFGWLPGMSPGRRERVIDAATSLLGVGYGLADYWALARYRRGSLRRSVLRRVTDTSHLLPGQFVTEAYRRAGIHLLPGRDAQDVTLDQLMALFLSTTAWEVRVPCTLYV